MTTTDVTSRLAAAAMVVACQTTATAIVAAHAQQQRRWGRRQRQHSPHLLHVRAPARPPRAITDDAVSVPMFGWQPPSGANPLEGALASAAPIEGLGALTGYWFLDVFAAMNVVLILSLVVVTSSKASSTMGGGDDDET
jgi:branched-subunit amino acid permease